MARPKAFDEGQALEGALNLFWAKGYEATSIQDLVDELGVNRQSLYDTFGGKEDLYHAALKRYCHQATAPLIRHLRGPAPLRKALRQLFHDTLEHLFSEGHPCFLAQAALERAEVDPGAKAFVNHGFRDARGLFVERIIRAQSEGEVGPHHDPEALAYFLHNALQGLQITARAGASRADLEAVVRVTLSVLG